jgi:hypothetical protein
VTTGATEDAAARRVIAGQGPEGICWRGTQGRFATSLLKSSPRSSKFAYWS